MSGIDSPHPQQKIVHLHYHYHYYNPQDQPTTAQDKKRMSKSQFIPNHRYQENVQNKFKQQKNICQPSNRSRENSFKKLRISNCWSQQNSQGKVQNKQKQVQLNSISSYTVKEDQMFIGEDDYSNAKEQSLLNYSMGTGTSERFQLQRKLASYKQELQWYKKQVQRLRNVQQQCIYLRKNCLAHYQNCQ